jgi:hypothetical protein
VKILKEFGLNLKGKDCFKKKFEKKRRRRKEKKEKLTFYLLSPAAHLSYPAAARYPPLLFFLFLRGTLTPGPGLSAPPSPFLSSSSPRYPADPAPPRDPRRARPPPLPPSLPLSAAN